MGFEREYRHLGSLVPPPQAVAINSSLSSRNKSTIGMLLLAYRMADIAASLDETPELSMNYERTVEYAPFAEVSNFFFSYQK